MDLTITPSPHVPSWIVPAASGALLISGAVFCDMCYALMFIRSHATKHEWRHASLVAENVGVILAPMVVLGCAANHAVAGWWLSAPGTGHGDKNGK
ncbi:hypothetical protein CORC01_12534 [Colletotrichum orchidophilum]|uniref:Uncharacterized protein n=1 Tax=Colletotrichum orchidophilum TaxID=1209926 RepID=A0A1G4ASP5_9PEZI|nr:uncharacterized protein CORC01_12534 [Colletotrichum orchidophilum]OHE92189.1 hypothetical protein CORC01_12534 [Colletotrichum orchidophilum]